MDLKLDGLRVLVVGGSGLIGMEVGRRFLAEGAQVVLAGRTRSTLDTAAKTLYSLEGRRPSVVPLDSTDALSVLDGVDAAAERMGGLDILVNSGAAAAQSLIAQSAQSGQSGELAEIAAAFDTKGMGYLRCARAALSHITAESGNGRIINICGQHVHLTDSLAASVRNVAVAALSKGLADELVDSKVTVNVVHPGQVVDDWDAAPPTAHGAPGPTTPAAIAALVAFLASPLAASISGAAIDIGHSIRGSSHF